jgi:hypothetical protein
MFKFPQQKCTSRVPRLRSVSSLAKLLFATRFRIMNNSVDYDRIGYVSQVEHVIADSCQTFDVFGKGYRIFALIALLNVVPKY